MMTLQMLTSKELISQKTPIFTHNSDASTDLNKSVAMDLHRLANEIESGLVTVQHAKVSSSFIGDGYDSKSVLEVEFLTLYGTVNGEVPKK